MKKQIELLKKYGVSNYTIKDGLITINGWLDLSSLASADKDFLKGTTINGGLYLSSLASADEDLLNKNVRWLQVGYSKEGGYCFFDGILSRVLSVSIRKGFTLYTTPIGFIAEKDGFTAHGVGIREAMNDCLFKSIAEKIKNEPIEKTTKINALYYHTVTGACMAGIQQWKQQNSRLIDKDEYKAGELMPILLSIYKEKPIYGFDKFKELVQW
jgi:hypothetical protein